MTKKQAYFWVVVEIIIICLINKFDSMDGATYYIALRLLLSNILGKEITYGIKNCEDFNKEGLVKGLEEVEEILKKHTGEK